MLAEELWDWILLNAEVVDGKKVCRASMWRYLEGRGVEGENKRRKMRERLTKELEGQGLISRENPRSRYVYILK